MKTAVLSRYYKSDEIFRPIVYYFQKKKCISYLFLISFKPEGNFVYMFRFTYCSEKRTTPSSPLRHFLSPKLGRVSPHFQKMRIFNLFEKGVDRNLLLFTAVPSKGTVFFFTGKVCFFALFGQIGVSE